MMKVVLNLKLLNFMKVYFEEKIEKYFYRKKMIKLSRNTHK
jgi:hypothetical protein